MELPKPENCHRCSFALEANGTCSNKQCTSNHPTWRPNASGKCELTSDRELEHGEGLRCDTCSQAISDSDPLCPHCAAPTSPTIAYRRVFNKSGGIPRQRVPTFEDFTSDPPTGVAPTLIRDEQISSFYVHDDASDVDPDRSTLPVPSTSMFKPRVDGRYSFVFNQETKAWKKKKKRI